MTTNEYGETYEGYTGDTEKLIYPATVRFEDLPLPQHIEMPKVNKAEGYLWMAVVIAMVVTAAFLVTVLVMKYTAIVLASGLFAGMMFIFIGPLFMEAVEDVYDTFNRIKRGK